MSAVAPRIACKKTLVGQRHIACYAWRKSLRPGSYAPAHVVWVDSMIVHYSNAQKKVALSNENLQQNGLGSVFIRFFILILILICNRLAKCGRRETQRTQRKQRRGRGLARRWGNQ